MGALITLFKGKMIKKIWYMQRKIYFLNTNKNYLSGVKFTFLMQIKDYLSE